MDFREASSAYGCFGHGLEGRVLLGLLLESTPRGVT
jgi:hypothetical protein